MADKIFHFTKDKLKTPIFFFVIFIAIALWRYMATGYAFYFVIFGFIGSTIAVCTLLSATLSRKYKPWGRRISQILIGLFMLGFLGFMGHENMQFEGFLFYLFVGLFHGALLHYFIAKLVGPALFGRAWCGWACWTVMVMDLFPWKKPEQGRIRYFGLFRYFHFFLSLGSIIILYHFLGYGFREHSADELNWLLYGNVAYYALAILLTVILKDNRAFCKYICPIPVTMKITTGLSLLKQKVDYSKCNECGLCEKNCLMDIKLLDYARKNQRVLSSECILCDTCINICPTEAILTTKGFDIGWKEYLNYSK